MNDDRFFDEVAKELLEKRVVPGVWTRAFADADGNTEKARAIYIRSRVAQLVEEEKLEREQAEELLRRQRVQEDRDRKQRLAAQIKQKWSKESGWLMLIFLILAIAFVVVLASLD
jgi:maltodextrin utilization protein YvdJ